MMTGRNNRNRHSHNRNNFVVSDYGLSFELEQAALQQNLNPFLNLQSFYHIVILIWSSVHFILIIFIALFIILLTYLKSKFSLNEYMI